MPKQPHATTPSSPIETKNPDFAGDCWRFGSKLRHAHSAQEIRDNKTKGFDLVPPSGVEGAFSIKHDPLYSPTPGESLRPGFTSAIGIVLLHPPTTMSVRSSLRGTPAAKSWTAPTIENRALLAPRFAARRT